MTQRLSTTSARDSTISVRHQVMDPMRAACNGGEAARRFLLACLIFLLVACGQPERSANSVVGMWVDLGDKAVTLDFRADGTIDAPDRPLLDDARYQVVDNSQIQVRVPLAEAEQVVQVTFDYQLAENTLTLTEPTSGQSTIYRRVTPASDLAANLPGSWVQAEDANALIEFRSDGSVAMEGFFGAAGGRYLLSEDRVVFELDGVPTREFQVLALGQQLLLRNDQGEYLILARLP